MFLSKYKLYFIWLVDCVAKGNAYISAGGNIVYKSDDGSQWTEVVITAPGDIIFLKNISEDSKHNCRVYEVLERGELADITIWSEPEVCPVCGDLVSINQND